MKAVKKTVPMAHATRYAAAKSGPWGRPTETDQIARPLRMACAQSRFSMTSGGPCLGDRSSNAVRIISMALARYCEDAQGEEPTSEVFDDGASGAPLGETMRKDGRAPAPPTPLRTPSRSANRTGSERPHAVQNVAGGL